MAAALGGAAALIRIVARGLFSGSRDEAKAARLFGFRALLAPRTAFIWAGHVEANRAALGAPTTPARVLGKPLRSYLMRGLSPTDRLDALLRHGRAAERLLGSEALAGLIAGEGFTIARLEARKGSVYRLELAPSDKHTTQREGEWVFAISKVGDDALLAKLTLALAGPAGSPVVGGLQGPQSGHKRKVIEATRELHGLRPKDATVLAVRAFARALGCEPVHAVKDANHVLAEAQGGQKFSSYDAYWLERGAEPDAAFGFRFAPLRGEADGDARGRLKRRIVEGVEAFVAAHRRLNGTHKP